MKHSPTELPEVAASQYDGPFAPVEAQRAAVADSIVIAPDSASASENLADRLFELAGDTGESVETVQSLGFDLDFDSAAFTFVASLGSASIVVPAPLPSTDLLAAGPETSSAFWPSATGSSAVLFAAPGPATPVGAPAFEAQQAIPGPNIVPVNHDASFTTPAVEGMNAVAISQDLTGAIATSAPELLAAPELAQPADSGLSLQYKGFDYVAFYNGAYEDSDSLPALVQTGANSIEVSLDYGIDAQTSQVVADPNYTDSLTALGDTIAQAESMGLTVMVRPLIDFLNPAESAPYSVGEWREDYQPTNVAAFFASYQQMIVAEAEVAQASGAQMLSIGAELDQLTGPQYLPYWTQIIDAVRSVFSGELTYSASWSTAGEVSFWNQLNYIGIDCYVPLSDAANPTMAQLIGGWLLPATPTHNPGAYAVIGNESPVQYFENLSAEFGKPLIFTELGYANDTGAAADPAASGNSPDPRLQAELYRAFFQAWDRADSSSLVGTYFWEWDPNGSTSNVGPAIDSFSPQNSPAQHQATIGFEQDSGTLAANLAALHAHHLLH